MSINTKAIKQIMPELRAAQTSELTEFYIYSQLADQCAQTNPKNSKVLRLIANEEKAHAHFWQTYTKQEVQPNQFKITVVVLMAKVFGLSFAIKLMEQGEDLAQKNYHQIIKVIPQVVKLEADEGAHERKLINMIDDEKLKYAGSMVLGVNDALVELTGALAGLTFALQNTQLIALSGLITGIAASFSMAGSEYLSIKSEAQDKDPIKAAIYTGIMYFMTVVALIAPYYIFPNVFVALVVTLLIAVLIIFAFTYYLSVAQDLPFKRRFLEMAGISLGVSTLTFAIGFFIRQFIGIEI